MVAQQIEQVKGDLERVFDELGFEEAQPPEDLAVKEEQEQPPSSSQNEKVVGADGSMKES